MEGYYKKTGKGNEEIKKERIIMGKYFSDAVDNAIEAIYYTYDREA